MDKIYLSTPTKIAILDHEKKRTFVIRKDGLPDAGEIGHIYILLIVCILDIVAVHLVSIFHHVINMDK